MSMSSGGGGVAVFASRKINVNVLGCVSGVESASRVLCRWLVAFIYIYIYLVVGGIGTLCKHYHFSSVLKAEHGKIRKLGSTKRA
jgi:hypothetical protein